MSKLDSMIPTLALTAALLLAGCGGDKSAEPAGRKTGDAASPARPFLNAAAEAAAPAAPADEAKEYQRVVYRCGNGKALVLRLYDDQRARVEIDHEVHVLRPVTADGGTLFLGDFVNVRVLGDKATASRNGIVLMSNCQVQTTP